MTEELLTLAFVTFVFSSLVTFFLWQSFEQRKLTHNLMMCVEELKAIPVPKRCAEEDIDNADDTEGGE